MDKMHEIDMIAWKLKYLSTKAGEMAESDLDWAIKMEHAFKRQGNLTARQAEVLDDICKKY